MRGERERLPGRPTISALSWSHVSYKSGKFWTVTDGRKLRRISTIELIPWFKVFKVLSHLHRLFNLSSNEDDHSTVAVSNDRIELEEK